MERKLPQSLEDGFDQRLLQITLDQLRTLVAVESAGSSRRAAQEFLHNRDQSSIEKQLKTLNGHFSDFAGEVLLTKPVKRGGEVTLTPAGHVVANLARSVLNSLDEALDGLRQMNRERPLRLALGTFLLPLLLEIQDELTLQFSRHGLKFSKELIHVRSSAVQEILLPKERDQLVDFSLGSFNARSDSDSGIEDELEFLELKRDRLVILTNYVPTASRVRVQDVSGSEWPLILPRDGVVASFVNQVWRDSGTLHVVEWCQHVGFALELLSLGAHNAGMLATGTIADKARSGPSKTPLHVVELDGCDLHLRIGLFRRKTDALAYLPRHPRLIFWNTCNEISTRRESIQGAIVSERGQPQSNIKGRPQRPKTIT